MRVLSYLTASLLSLLSLSVSAQDADAITNAFPGQQWNVWVSAKGDLNNDRVSDVAAVLTRAGTNGPREEVLVFLVGQSDGRYVVRSVSGPFCQVRHHYNIEIKKDSLFVTGYPSLNGSSFKMQFRYDPERNDLLMIGEERSEENEQKQSLQKVSINYLTKTTVSVCRIGGKQKESKIKIDNLSAIPLQGFNCSERYIGGHKPCGK